MTKTKDSWEKPRGHHDHLSDEEIKFVRDEYRNGASREEIAATLKCSSRTVARQFVKLRQQGVARGARRPAASAPDVPRAMDTIAAQKSARFYRSDFVPT